MIGEVRASLVATALVCLVFILKGIRDLHHLIHYETPQQLVDLVTQAHAGGPIKTRWEIEVSPEMRDALRLPLTPQQLEEMNAAGEDVFSSSVSCYLLSHKVRSGELSGVMKVSVTVHSKYSKTPLVYPEVKLRILVKQNGKQYPHLRWRVASVEQV